VDLLDRVGLEHPVAQAGMGGGVVDAALAGAVSAAGALGTIGLLSPRAMHREIGRARELAPGRPVAANLLVPFTHAAHVAACIDAGAALVVFHGGSGQRWFETLRTAGIPVLCTVGSVAQARKALAVGVDGLVVQGVEAGGHLMGTEPLAELLPRIRELDRGLPLLAAGGIAERSDVVRVLNAGATVAVAGTRFLLTSEAKAHPEYQQRLLHAERTLRTMLFGVGWPLAHRVVPNAATERWCGPEGEVRASIRLAGRASALVSRALPASAGNAMARVQRANVPLFGPTLPIVGMPDDAVDRTALYAGETALRITDIVSAREVVSQLCGS
jgi:NAD(P)H-dependent flavin oxidoreductase YrpB (nitropropane dioxygenase family)